MKHVVESNTGKLYEVTTMFDRNSMPTTDPWLASTCVIKAAEDAYVTEDADPLDIHAVH